MSMFLLEDPTMSEEAPTRSLLLDTFNTQEFSGWYEDYREDAPTLRLPKLDTYPVVTDLVFDVVQESENLITGSAILTLANGRKYTARIRVKERQLEADCTFYTFNMMGSILKVWLDHFIMGLLRNDDLEDGAFSIVDWNDLPA